MASCKDMDPPKTLEAQTLALLEQLSVGTVVDIKEYGRAIVVQVVTGASHPRFGRCLVRYDDGKTYFAAPEKLRMVKPVSSNNEPFVSVRSNE